MDERTDGWIQMLNRGSNSVQQTSGIKIGNERIVSRWKWCGFSLISARCWRPKKLRHELKWWKCKGEKCITRKTSIRWYLNGCNLHTSKERDYVTSPFFISKTVASLMNNEIKATGSVCDAPQTVHTSLQPLSLSWATFVLCTWD